MDIVLVHRWINAGHEQAFFADYASQQATAPPALLAETLCRCADQPEAGVIAFVNIAEWSSREAFEGYFKEIPPPATYEARLRTRTWLFPERQYLRSNSS